MLKRLAVLPLVLTCLASVSEAKELRQRLGIGIKNNSSVGTPMVAAVYYTSNDIGFTGGLGIDTLKDNSKLVLSVGARRNLFFEQQMNFYFGGNLAMVNNEVATVKQSGWELSAIFGAEFFFTGLENLALTFEGGVGVVSLDQVRFVTIADSPFKAGFIFYF